MESHSTHSWFSIHQTDRDEKLKGAQSLIHYVTLCKYMLIPAQEVNLQGSEAFKQAKEYPALIPDYGPRGWCRLEWFIFSLLNEMQADRQEVQLYVIQRKGNLLQFPRVRQGDASYMPSKGDLSNPNDRQIIKAMEDKMIRAYGERIVNKAAAAGTEGNLKDKMIRPEHLASLGAAVKRYGSVSLNLDQNELGTEGVTVPVEFWETLVLESPTLTSLR